MSKETKDIFCGLCNAVTSHTLTFAGGEVIATCTNPRRKHTQEAIDTQHELPVHEVTGHPIFTDEHFEEKETPCGHFQKFPASSSEALRTAIDRHNADNKPRVLAEDIHRQYAEGEKILRELLSNESEGSNE